MSDRESFEARRRAAAPAEDGGLVESASALARYAGQVGRRFAVVNALEKRARRVEERIVSGIGERLQRRERGGAGTEAEAQRAYYVAVHEPPGPLLRELLALAGRQSPDDAAESFYSSLLRQLTPDEAQLLRCFSDGAPRATLHLDSSSRAGGARLAGYFSLVASEVALGMPSMAPHYLQRLTVMGLLVERESATATKAQHGSLQADAATQEALRALRAARYRPKLRFASLRLSALGEALWKACAEASTQEEANERRLGQASRDRG